MPKIEDFGEKIGGARKDLYRLDRELRVDDITDWSDIDRDKYITKKEVFPRPDYDKLYAEGLAREVLFFIKRIRDALPSKPEPHLPYNVSAEEKRALLHSEQEKYIRSIGEIYTKTMELNTFSQCKAFYDQLCENDNILAKYINSRKFIKAADLDNSFSISMFHRDLVKKQFLYSDSEKKLSKYSILYYNGSNVRSVEVYGNRKALEIQAGSGSRYYSYNNGELGDLNNWKADTYFALDEKRQVVLINSETKQQLLEKLLEIENVKAASVSSKKRKGKFIPPQLKHIRPTKQDHRQGRNITGEDMMNIFGFRAGEFGNWETENDKQTNLNMSYDAFKDLANALGISDADISLGGQLAIAYGSRGVKSAAAHFEPGANVINLTKMNGAGSLGHEWGHALDFYISQTMGYSSIFASDRAFSKDNIIYDVMDAIKYTEDHKRTKYLQDAMKLDALHSKDAQGYWQSNVELFARAFASYVHDKLGVSDYLVGHSEAQSADGTHISPQGEERKRINLEFDRLMNNLKERKLLTKRLDNDLMENEKLTVSRSDLDNKDFAIDDGVLIKYIGTGSEVTIPDGVTSIGTGAFEDFTSLKSITIPDSVTYIGNKAFENCTSLERITIPDSVESIDFRAFRGCTNLTSVTISNSVTSIEDYVFEECTSLTNVTIPDSVESIGNGAFAFCTSLESVTIPDSVIYIGAGAFQDCTSLTNVTIPDGVTSIGNGAFAFCTSLESVIIPDSVESIGRRVFEGTKWLVNSQKLETERDISEQTKFTDTDIRNVRASELSHKADSILSATTNIPDEIRDNAKKALIVNLYGGPGAGKSTTALQLVAELKKHGLHAEYVSEVAKDLVYAKAFDKLDGSLENQTLILTEQKNRLDMIAGNVDVAITDSPLMLNTVYLSEHSEEHLSYVLSQYNEYNNFNIFISRDTSVPFENEERIHNLKESMEKDGEILSLLESNNIEFERFDRDNISRIADVVLQKLEKEKSFSQQVDDVLEGKANRYSDLKVCDTPQKLIDVGCEQLPMLFTQKHLRNAVKPKNLKETHGLSVDQLKKMPIMLNEPVMIYDSLSRSDSLVVITSEFDSENNPIIISVQPNGSGKYNLERVNTNFITSIYGRENFVKHLEREIKSDNLLYADKQKSQELFSVLGLQFSKGLNNLDFNIIIHQSRNIVKGLKEKNLKVNEKVTLTVDEKDILLYAEKIRLNKAEDERFSAALDELINGDIPVHKVIDIGKTPNVLKVIGVSAEKLTVNQSVIKNSLNAEDVVSHGHTSGHGLTADVIRQLPSAIRSPIMICSGSKVGTLVAVTELKDKNNKNVIASIAINILHEGTEISKVTSVYGKNNINNTIERGVIAVNKEKASQLGWDIEANSSQSALITCFDNSIAYTDKNVKRGNENFCKSVTVTQAEKAEIISFRRSGRGNQANVRQGDKSCWCDVEKRNNDYFVKLDSGDMQKLDDKQLFKLYEFMKNGSRSVTAKKNTVKSGGLKL